MRQVPLRNKDAAKALQKKLTENIGVFDSLHKLKHWKFLNKQELDRN